MRCTIATTPAGTRKSSRSTAAASGSRGFSGRLASSPSCPPICGLVAAVRRCAARSQRRARADVADVLPRTRALREDHAAEGRALRGSVEPDRDLLLAYNDALVARVGPHRGPPRVRRRAARSRPREIYGRWHGTRERTRGDVRAERPKGTIRPRHCAPRWPPTSTPNCAGVRRWSVRTATTCGSPGRGKPLDAFGSQGQQRTAVLALKVAEYETMHARTGDAPILLLDDVLSRARRRAGRRIPRAVGTFEQAFLTATDLCRARRRGGDMVDPRGDDDPVLKLGERPRRNGGRARAGRAIRWPPSDPAGRGSSARTWRAPPSRWRSRRHADSAHDLGCLEQPAGVPRARHHPQHRRARGSSGSTRLRFRVGNSRPPSPGRSPGATARRGAAGPGLRAPRGRSARRRRLAAGRRGTPGGARGRGGRVLRPLRAPVTAGRALSTVCRRRARAPRRCGVRTAALRSAVAARERVLVRSRASTPEDYDRDPAPLAAALDGTKCGSPASSTSGASRSTPAAAQAGQLVLLLETRIDPNRLEMDRRCARTRSANCTTSSARESRPDRRARTA